MKPKTIQGFVLIDAPYSALNNAGKDPSERTDNIVKTKSIWRSGQLYPYVSGQAWRYWWRDALVKHKEWKLSPITREKKIAFTEANPIEYQDDDIFGYMRAKSKAKGEKKAEETLTRVSVLKNSPLISVIAQRPTTEFGTFSRHEGDPVPFEHEFYSTILKGIFTLDLNTAGVFLRKKRSGMQNLREKFTPPTSCEIKGKTVWLPKKERIKRVKEVIDVIPHLSGGAMQARHLTRVAPSLVVIGVFNTGGHLLSHLAKEDKGKPEFHLEALTEMLKNNTENFASKIYIGLEKGFMEQIDKKFAKLASEEENLVYYPSVIKAISEFGKTIDNFIPDAQ
ncbi:MAG: type I-B CRISPR-associated protein Cas7/Cst2/DevR [Candidatus Heimdallarchaeota archaeon]